MSEEQVKDPETTGSGSKSESTEEASLPEAQKETQEQAKEALPQDRERAEIAGFKKPATMLLVGAGLSTAASVGGIPGFIICLAGTSLLGAVWLMWSSLQQVGEGDEMGFEEALSLAAPTATEEQKRAVLRALKDLEYERHVGKISEEDFQKVSSEYRQQAKELIAQADESMAGRLQAAEKRVKKHLSSNEEAEALS